MSVLAAVIAVSALNAAEKVNPFNLVDQAGKPTVIDRSENYTLITFYRGDW